MTETILDNWPAWALGLGSVGLTAARIVLIALLAWLSIRLLHRAMRGLRNHLTRDTVDSESVKRAETLARVTRHLVSVVVSAVAFMLMLSELGVALAPILGAAGVAGLAVGFGAQSLVKDYFTGFFLLLENQIRQGDVVELGGHSGLVEEVTLRYVKLRDYFGNVHFVPNGQITTVTNMTRDFSQAVVDIKVAYREDLDRAMALMHEVANGLRADSTFGPRILDDLDMAGVDQWADSAIIVRARLRCVPLEQWGVRREYLRRLKQAFDRNGIDIPVPHLRLDEQSAARFSGARGATSS